MKYLVLILASLALAACGSDSSKSGGGAGPAKPQDCKARYSASSSGVTIQPAEMFGQEVTYNLIRAEAFMHISSKDRFAFLGFTINVVNGQPSFQQNCAGASEGVNNQEWNFSSPYAIRGMDGTVLQALSADMAGTPLQARFKMESGNGEKLDFSKFPANASYSLKRISADTVEIWFRLPADRGNGEFVFRNLYKAIPNTVNPSPNPNPNPNPVPQPQPSQELLELYKAAYEYANGFDGPNMGAAEARAFAEEVTALGVATGTAYLNTHKEAFTYVYDVVSLNRPETKKYAAAIAQRETEKPGTLSLFKKSYDYAYDADGLNLSREKALEFARQRTGVVIN